MSVLVDSNVLLDIATEDERWFGWSSETLARVGGENVLVVDPVIYAEVSVAYERIEDLEVALPASTYRRDPLPYDAAFLAGRAFHTAAEAEGRPPDARLLYRRTRSCCRLSAADPVTRSATGRTSRPSI